MPYYSWNGIDLKGTMHKGTLFARSKSELDLMLIKQEIGLIRCKKATKKVFGKTIGLIYKIQFFKQLAHLLSTGVLLPDALTVVGSQMHNVYFQEVISDILNRIHQGNTFSACLLHYPKIFNVIMIKMIEVGQESGDMANAMNKLVNYLEARQDCAKKFRSALLVPVFTFGFFCCVMLLIFLVIIPQFIDMFQAVKQELPWVTKKMITISHYMRSSNAFHAVILLCIISLLSIQWSKQKKGKIFWDTFFINIPYISRLIRINDLGYFLYALSMLLESGIRVIPAMDIAQDTINNSVVRHHIDHIKHDINAGFSISQAMLHDPQQLFGPEIMSVIRVGEESGCMAALLARAGFTYQEMVQRSLIQLSVIINPLLMVVLGLLITFLIFSIYVPLLSISNAITF